MALLNDPHEGVNVDSMLSEHRQQILETVQIDTSKLELQLVEHTCRVIVQAGTLAGWRPRARSPSAKATHVGRGGDAFSRSRWNLGRTRAGDPAVTSETRSGAEDSPAAGGASGSTKPHPCLTEREWKARTRPPALASSQ